MSLRRFAPFLDLKGYTGSAASKDMMAAVVTTFMAVPQGIAYAMIAGLPPAMGLYASTLPSIIGAMMRSSRHVITGPTNAMSLLIGGGVLAMADLDPVTFAVSLALLVGLLQVAAGYLRLGAIVDYISNPVVLGYITGAGLLIGIGQLPNLTATTGASGHVITKISAWIEGVGSFSPLALGMAVGTAVLILILRRINRSLPSAAIALGVATLATWYFDLHGMGLSIVRDLTPVPAGLPPLTLPDVGLFPRLLTLAIACTVLSLVESSAVARALAAQSGQRLDTSAEFAGQGWGNVMAAFVGGFPTSGSLSRSGLNLTAGAETRLAGVFSGLMMIVILLFLGPAANYTPVAALAGLLVIVAIGLVDLSRIKITMMGPWSDRTAFLVTLLGTWFMPLDKAIYLGVGISIVLFLRQARLLVVHELGVDKNRHLRDLHEEGVEGQTCTAIRILHIEGHLFFGAVGELQSALDEVIANERVRVLVLRVKRTIGMDVTVATALEAAAIRLKSQGRHLVLAGVRPEIVDVLKRTRVFDVIGNEAIFPAEAKWFKSLKDAVAFAQELVGDDVCAECPLRLEMHTSEAFDDDELSPGLS